MNPTRSNQHIPGSGADPKTVLLLLLAAVFASRCLPALILWRLNGPAVFFSPDSFEYLTLAQSLLHGSFSDSGVPEVVRTPGYPLLLGLAVALHHPLLIGLLTNAVLATITAWLIWQIANDLAPRSKACVWAVLLYCLEPVGFLYSEKLLSDVPFSPLFLAFVWQFLRFLRKPTYARLAVAALILGLATYIRPVSLLLSLWLIPVFFLLPRGLSWTKRIAYSGVFVLIFAAVLAPWIVRNTQIAGYRGFSAITDINLYFYYSAALKAKLEHIGYSQAQQELGWNSQQTYFQLHPDQRDWPQARILRFQGDEGRRTIAGHRLVYAFIHLRGCVITLLDPAATELMKLFNLYPASGGLIYRSTDTGPIRAAFWLVQHYPVVGAALLILGGQLLIYYLLGIAGLKRLPMEALALCVWLFLYFILVSGSSNADARFRVPIMPLICIAGGAALAGWHKRSPVNPEGAKTLATS